MNSPFEQSAIEVTDIRKAFGATVAVDGVSFRIDLEVPMLCSVKMVLASQLSSNCYRGCFVRTRGTYPSLAKEQC